MIVSHKHRFIFAAVPKTGTHSVRQALREQLGEGDVEQVGLFVDKRFPWPDLAAIRHGHLALRQVRPHLGEAAFAGYFKFAFVRNPFDRFVSYCAFMTRMRGDFDRDPRGTMRRILFEVRPLDGDSPRFAARLRTANAQFAVYADQIGCNPKPLQASGELVDTETFGYSGEIEGDGGEFADALAGLIKFEAVYRRQAPASRRCRTARRIVARFRRAESPIVHQIAHPDVEGAAGITADPHGLGEHDRQSSRHRDPLSDGGSVEARQIGVRFPGGHLPIHGIDRREERGPDQGLVDRLGEETRGIAGAHGVPAERAAMQVGHVRRFSRHLRHTGPAPSWSRDPAPAASAPPPEPSPVPAPSGVRRRP